MEPSKPSPVHYLLLPLLYLASIIICTRFATVIHEFSHGLIPVLYGGRIREVHISLFAGGYINTEWSGAGIMGDFFFSMSGIIANFIAGLAALVFFRMIRSEYVALRMLLILFAMINILGALSYLVIGLYYEFGDPVGWAITVPTWYKLLWIPGLIISPLLCYYVARHFSRFQQELAPASGFFGRVAVSLLTLGISIGIYAALAAYTDEEIYSQRMSDKEKVVVSEKVVKEVKRIKQENPAISEGELAEKVEEIKEKVIKEEVRPRFPVVYPYAGALLLGGLVALYQEKKPPGKRARVSGITAIALSFIAVSILAILYYIDGGVYVA